MDCRPYWRGGMPQLGNQILSSFDSSDSDLLLTLPPSCNRYFSHNYSSFHPSNLSFPDSVKEFHPSLTEQRENNRSCALLSFRLVFPFCFASLQFWKCLRDCPTRFGKTKKPIPHSSASWNENGPSGVCYHAIAFSSTTSW